MSNESNYAKVRNMYHRFGIHSAGGPPHLISKQQQEFRLAAIREECDELEQAYDNGDLPGIADALVDLVVFALGTAVVHDLPWEDLFTEVMRANNEKEVGQGNKLRSSDGVVDLVKPDGWEGPYIHRILIDRGWHPLIS